MNKIIAFLIALCAIDNLYAARLIGEGKEARLRITREECERIFVDYMADPSVAYRPQDTVDHDAITPADLPSNYPIVLSDQIHVPIEIPLHAFYPVASTFPWPFFGYTRRGYGGVVTLDMRHGDLFYNGKPMEAEHMQVVRRACYR